MVVVGVEKSRGLVDILDWGDGRTKSNFPTDIFIQGHKNPLPTDIFSQGRKKHAANQPFC